MGNFSSTEITDKTRVIQVSCPDGSSQTVPAGITAREAYARLKGEVPADAFAVKIDGVPRDWNTVLDEDVTLEPITFSSPEGKEIYHHSSAHILAQAVKECFPSVNLTIGPPIEDGFYYDFAFERTFTPEDLTRIEEKAKDIIAANFPIRRLEMSKGEAIELFRRRGEQYKVELLEGIPDDTVSLYQQGEFIDLCRGPHVESTGQIKALKVLSSAGAYWRGDERNPMLQRIYGTSFPSQEALDAHLAKLEEIKRRDHRKLGKELDLFSIQDEIGPGLILWHPKGARVRLLIEDLWRAQHLQHGYELVYSPHIARLDLWKTSGHVDYYRENMFAPITVESSEYQLKPMNCPFHILLYKAHLRSYRDLPVRYGELGTVYRYERSGVLHGLLRVRGFTQDDAHIFCRPDQIAEEVKHVLSFMTMMLQTFGFDSYKMFLSTKPDKAVGSEEQWEQATQALATALNETGFAYEVDPGEGVFYGPKIDVKIRDGLGRLWQCSTVQIDFNNPQRFGLSFIGEDGKTHQPIMIHRALLGSIERFFGILLEHYAGAFPVWLAPIQACVLPITNKQHEYASQIAEQLRAQGCRVDVDLRNEKVGLKIRDAERAKIPYMLIVGERERQANCIAVRKRNGQDLGTMTIPQFRDLVRQDEPRVSSRGSTLSE